MFVLCYYLHYSLCGSLEINTIVENVRFFLVLLLCILYISQPVTSLLYVCIIFSVLRDITERGRTLESVLSQYTNFVKPAFEEFCLPVSIFPVFPTVLHAAPQYPKGTRNYQNVFHPLYTYLVNYQDCQGQVF